MEIPIPHLPSSGNAQGDSTFGKLSSQDRAFLEAFGRQEAQELHGVPRPSPVDPTSLLGQLEQVTVSGYRALRPSAAGQAEPPPLSSSSQPRRHDVVCELAAEEVRWFYKREVEKNWTPFMGYDSLRIELRYRHIWQTKWSDVDRRTNTLREEYHHPHRASVRTMMNNAHQQRRARSLSRVHYDRTGGGGPHTAMLMNGYVDESAQSTSGGSYSAQHHPPTGPPMHHHPRATGPGPEDYYEQGGDFDAGGGVPSGASSASILPPPNYNPYAARGPHYATRGRHKSYRHYRSADNFGSDDREMRIVVRGGVYEVDLVEWKCHSIYWPGEAFDILRGTWFHENTWQPVQTEHADRIEREHLSRFLNHKMADYVWDPTTSSRLEKQVHHTINFPEFHVDWLSPEEVYLHRENASSQIYRGISASLGFKKPTGTRLFRGYRELSSHADKLADISHIVFVIHGVGQVVDDTTILRNTNILRDNVHTMIEKHFKSYQEETGQRIEFFPVEWRSSLTLDEGIVNIITPQRIMGLRNLLNSSAMDIMYYTSPLYRMEIWGALQEELNRLYEMFIQRNPYFEANGGTVSITAHSLGCVVTYDILTGWTQDVEHSWYSMQAGNHMNHNTGHHPHHHGRGRGRHPSSMGEGSRQAPMNAAQSGLLFRIENFFCLGSPLSVFLTLRWREPQNTEYHDYILPRSLCKYLYNIYHPCDPVAYRVEPIFMKFYSQIEPVHLYSENDPNKTPYDKIPLQPLQGARKDSEEGGSMVDFTDSMLPVNIANGSINISVGKMAAGIGNPAKDFSNKIPSMTPSISLPKIPTSVQNIPGLQAASSGVSGALNGSSVGQAAGGMMGGLFGFVKDAAAAVTPDTHTTHSSSYSSGHHHHHQSSRPGMPSVLPTTTNTTSSALHGYTTQFPGQVRNQNVPAKPPTATHHQEVKLPDGQRLAYRMDYVLRETGNTYIAAVTSHTAYWSNADVAYFMVKKLYPDLEKYPPSSSSTGPQVSSNGNNYQQIPTPQQQQGDPQAQ